MIQESSAPDPLHRSFRSAPRGDWALLILCGLLFIGGGCSEKRGQGIYQGYVEAEYVYVAAPLGGELLSLALQRGQEVKKGTPLFALDPEPEATARQEAQKNLERVQAQLANLRKGRRPTELAALAAKLDQARVSLQLADLELKRLERLREENVVALDDLDRARSTRDYYTAQMTELGAQLDTAKLGARADEIRAAEAQVEGAEAALARSEWNVSQKSQDAPADAVIHDTLYRPGEWVAPGNPVMVLLPPENLKIRFFVPQADLARMKSGAGVTIQFDGAPAPYQGQVSYVSTRAEFTPPIIYSQQTRAKLVFMVEARLVNGDLSALRPGQPVDVSLAP